MPFERLRERCLFNQYTVQIAVGRSDHRRIFLCAFASLRETYREKCCYAFAFLLYFTALRQTQGSDTIYTTPMSTAMSTFEF